MKKYFYELADFGIQQVSNDEVLLLNFAGEDSQFCRFNHNSIRQAGDVSDRGLTVTLISGSSHSSASQALSQNMADDCQALKDQIQKLREVVKVLPGDPYLLYATEVCSTETVAANTLPDGREMAREILNEAAGMDLVGFLASGAIFRGFANSFGQKNWYEKYTFNFDWSAYHHRDKAVKSAYAGDRWQTEQLRQQIAEVREHLLVLALEAKTIPPGDYRVYLAPAAVAEIAGMLSWGGFSEKAMQTKQSPLLKLRAGEKSLHPSVSFIDDRASGLVPDFDAYGFTVAPRVDLIERGQYVSSLISPRTAREYSLVPNSGSEAPAALTLAPGPIRRKDVLAKLDTGIYINNLWYLNYSDRNGGKLTGMTRFATFWVENGRVVAPLNVMRFDDSIYSLLGEHLSGLTEERDFIMDSSTYESRNAGGMCLPGALIDRCRFTL